MKRQTAVVLAIFLMLGASAACRAADAALPAAQANIASGTVLLAPGAPDPKLAATSAPPPMPAGFVVVSTNHIDQVAATAKLAIEAAKSSEESLVRMLSVAGVVIAFILAVAAFFGLREFKDMRDKHREMTGQYGAQLKELESIKNDAVPRLQAMLAAAQDMEGILIDLSFLRNVHQQLSDMMKRNSPDLRKTALEALPEGQLLYERAKSHYERLLSAESSATAELGRRSSAADGERVLSYIVALMGVIAMRAESLDEAVDWARLSVRHNPLSRCQAKALSEPGAAAA